MSSKFLNFTNVVYDDDTSTSKYSIVKTGGVTKKFSLPKNFKSYDYVVPSKEAKRTCESTLGMLDQYVYTKSEFKNKLQKFKDEVYEVIDEVFDMGKKFTSGEEIDNNLSFKVYATGISKNEVRFNYDEYFDISDSYVKQGDDNEDIIILDKYNFTLFNEKTTLTYDFTCTKLPQSIEYHDRDNFTIDDMYVRYDEDGNRIILTNISNVFNYTAKDDVCYNVEPRDIPVSVLFLQSENPIIPDINVVKTDTNKNVVRIDNDNLFNFTDLDETPHSATILIKVINVSPTDDLAEKIAEIKESDILTGLKLSEATFTSDITIDSYIEIYGNKAGVPASAGYRCQDGDIYGETIIDGYVTLNGDCDVLFDGITFKNNANFNLTGAKKVVFKNCRFISLYPNNIIEENKSSPFLLNEVISDNDTLFVFIDCFFGDTPSIEGKYTSDYFTIKCKLADGSSFINNYFTDEVCTDNIINIYDLSEESNIHIKRNLFEDSRNAIKLSPKGEPYATLYITDNIYNESSVTPTYQGLMRIQPYGTLTTDMSNISIDFTNNDCLLPISHHYYVIYGPSDTQLVKELQPKIYINGILQ